MMDPLVSFVRTYESNIIGYVGLAKFVDSEKDVFNNDVKSVQIDDEYVNFVGATDVLRVPIDGAIVDYDWDNGVKHMVTIFNHKCCYIITNKIEFY